MLRVNADVNIFTDASDIAAARFVQGTDEIMHRHWLQVESKKSSPWREVKAIKLCIDTFADKLENGTVTFFTDNQNAVSIIQKGNRVPELQKLAFFYLQDLFV